MDRLSETQLSALIMFFEPVLLRIFKGKKSSDRHDEYAKKGQRRTDLKFRVWAEAHFDAENAARAARFAANEAARDARVAAEEARQGGLDLRQLYKVNGWRMPIGASMRLSTRRAHTADF